jgi:type II secretory pathway pseudopilin PulG
MKKQSGQSLIELVVAIGIFVIVVSILIFLVLGSYIAGRLASEITQADFLAEEGLEAARSIRDDNWDKLNIGIHYLDLDDSTRKWRLTDQPELIERKFTRVITVEEIGPHRKKITSKVTWQFTETKPQEVKLITYFTNWAKAAPSLAQLHYRWRNDNGGE